MAKSDRRAADAAMAARMAQYPHQYPDSTRPGGHPGNGVEYRRMKVPAGINHKYNIGLLGGVLCAKLGLGNYNIPKELLA